MNQPTSQLNSWPSAFTEEERAKRSTIARKVVEGLMLSYGEWDYANEHSMLGPRGDRLGIATYYGYLASYYNAEGVKGEPYGMICLQHATENDGIEGNYGCGFGLHMNQLNPKYLTDINVYLLISAFGEEKVRKVLSEYKPRAVKK